MVTYILIIRRFFPRFLLTLTLIHVPKWPQIKLIYIFCQLTLHSQYWCFHFTKEKTHNFSNRYFQTNDYTIHHLMDLWNLGARRQYILSLSPHNLKDLSFRQLYPGINQEILITETGIVPRGYTQGCRDNFIGNSSNSAAAVSWSLILQTETESGRKLFQLQFLVQFYLSR